MKPCVKKCPHNISTNICSKGGLGNPSKHRMKQTENDQAGYLYIKHKISTWNEKKNNYERDIQ